MTKWTIEVIGEDDKVRPVGTVDSPYWKGTKGARQEAVEKYPELKGKSIIATVGEV